MTTLKRKMLFMQSESVLNDNKRPIINGTWNMIGSLVLVEALCCLFFLLY